MSPLTSPDNDREKEIRRRRVKNAVRRNFDASVEAYEDFEAATGLFAGLAAGLCARGGVAAGMRVLDVGCGTGIATTVIADMVGEDGEVVGLDLSEEMLEEARARIAEGRGLPRPSATADSGRSRSPAARIRLVWGDAENLSHHVEGPFDAVLFTASVFLLPDPARALGEAAGVLRTEGRVAANVLGGAEIAAGEDLYSALEAETGHRLRRPSLGDVDPGRELLAPYFDDLWEEDERFCLSIGDLERFFLIPAQSAGLLPKLKYEERRTLLAPAFRALEAREVGKAREARGPSRARDPEEGRDPALSWRSFGGRKKGPCGPSAGPHPV